MIYKKEYKVEGKIITKNDIINMVTSILKAFPSEEEISTEIEAKFNDNISIEDNSLSIFDNIYFDKKLLERINIDIRCSEFNNTIYIDISNNYFGNKIQVKVSTKNIYDSVCHSIEENLGLMNNQNWMYRLANNSWSYPALYLLIIMLELSLILVLENIFSFKLPSVIIYLMILLLPGIIALFIIKYIEKYYPTNQFYFGDSSVNKPYRNKSVFFQIIIFIMTNIILPIILSMITG